MEDFDVLLTVRLSIYISVFNQLDAQNLFHIKIYFMPPHVRAHVLIIRRSKLHYTASGIITPIVGRLVHETTTYTRTLFGIYIYIYIYFPNNGLVAII